MLALYKALRIYRKQSLSNLMVYLLCNRIMKSKFIVAQSPSIYKYSSKIFGHKFISSILSNSFCKMLTGGTSVQQLALREQYYRSRNIPIIIDYCAEGDINDTPNQQILNMNAQKFFESANRVHTHQNELISIKVSGLMDMRLLKKYNDAVNFKYRLIEQCSDDGVIKGSRLFEWIQNNVFKWVTEQQFQGYLSQVFNNPKEKGISEFTISCDQFEMVHHPFYIYCPEKNNNFITQILMPLDTQEKKQMISFICRLETICRPFKNNQHNFRIIADAEQSYIQKGIESIMEQVQEEYNQQRIYIIVTLQNYLKNAQKRLNYEIAIAKKKNIYFGVKLVRGAYIVEEKRIALSHEDCPIVDNFQKTTQNYLSNFQKIVKNIRKGEVFVASHNENTLKSVIELSKRYQNKQLVLSFAQLMGLGDHLTLNLKNLNYTVYKLIPWAKVEVMVPYMIRRAEQLSQMRYPLDTQYSLIKHQLFKRIF